MRTGHWEGDLIKTAQDGRQIVVSSRWALQWGKRDQAPRILEINSDITERKQERSCSSCKESNCARWRSACNGCAKRIASRSPAICMIKSGRF
jgi:hypothetical protein